MAVALVEYQVEDAPIVFQLQSRADISIRSRKVELVLAALCSLNSPIAKKDIFSTPSFMESVALIKRMSVGGKLSFARQLLEQISA